MLEYRPGTHNLFSDLTSLVSYILFYSYNHFPTVAHFLCMRQVQRRAT
uniref:Uncharacterized protein n=1 Tax=Anguilla anguilla TaxID=7936 RepID=A0A0E9XLQ7_ANGAN